MDANDDRKGPLIFIIAGEPSGDLLGGRLMAALKAETGGRVRFVGLGGDQMTRQGLRSIFPIAELGIFGLLEVILHLPQILRRIRETAAAVQTSRPDVVVTIDSPGFSLRVARRLKALGTGVPLVHYVAPTVWAWKPGRAKNIAQYLNRLLAVLPFEPPYFEVHGLPCDFVGHPAVEDVHKGDGPAFRVRHGIPADAPLLCAMPGSRNSEIIRLLPIYRATVQLLLPRLPSLYITIPTLPNLHDAIVVATADWPVPVVLVHEHEEKYDAFAAANVALVKAGTSGLEVAIAGLPCVITQRINWLSAWLARRMLRIQLFSLVNILLKREVQPEFIQEDCTPEKLSTALAVLFENPQLRQEQIEGSRAAAHMLGFDDEAPSRRAAHAVLQVIQKERLATQEDG